jgi:hypothetical protein
MARYNLNVCQGDWAKIWHTVSHQHFRLRNGLFTSFQISQNNVLLLWSHIHHTLFQKGKERLVKLHFDSDKVYRRTCYTSRDETLFNLWSNFLFQLWERPNEQANQRKEMTSIQFLRDIMKIPVSMKFWNTRKFKFCPIIWNRLHETYYMKQITSEYDVRHDINTHHVM